MGWREDVCVKLRASIPYAFSCDGSSAPVMSEEEFGAASEYLVTEIEELMKKSFMLGNMVGVSDVLDGLKQEGVEVSDFDESLDKHYSEIKWEGIKSTI
jgi:hypothetical protein